MEEKLTKEVYLRLKNPSNCFDKIKNIRAIPMVENADFVFAPDVSFVIPTYKRSETIRETIASIIEQPPALSFEIIIIDNSADVSENNTTLQCVKQLKDSRIRYFVNEHNIGLANNWNRGFILARSRNVIMLHDDDLLGNNYLPEIKMDLEIARKHQKFGLLVAKHRDYRPSQEKPMLKHTNRVGIIEIKKRWCLYHGIGPTCCPTCGMVFDKQAFLTTGGFNDLYSPAFDYIPGYLLLKNGYKCYETSNELSYYRISINESTKKDINIGFVVNDYFFREFLYTESILWRIFGFFFKKTQYSLSVDDLYRNATKRFGCHLQKDEMKLFAGYGRHLIGKFCFKVFLKLFMINNQKIITH